MYPKGANSMALSGLVCRNDLVGTGRAISVVGPLFPAFKVHFSATAGWHFSRHLTRCLLIGGCGQSHVLLRMAEITSGSSFEPNNPTEQKLGCV